uniref:protein-tyrosine-phosphatase n=2 Tax=Timema TaxID=61471 RepID=A0A7R9IEV0_9NEOP|nr:unnamed protein product [Timema bartmani]CAD7456981.1 unnamed protein product [Timema tahoe]
MPSEDDSDRVTMMELCVSKEWLLQELRSNPSRLVILDCRSSNEYGESHIRHAVNFSIPSIMLRRLAAGKIDLMSTIKCRELKVKIMNAYKENVFVVYGDVIVTDQQRSPAVSFTAGDTLHVLAKRLAQDGCHVHLGSSCSSAATSSTDSSDSDDRCDSSLGLEDDRDFPVKILPHLFLGNQATSADSDALTRHNIQYILNVTADLPNVFEDSGTIKYMQIPIADHWSQNLASFFPKAFKFIDEARSNEKGILVHCLAGVSRSVTVTVAYLMYKLSLNLNDAFNLVRSRKSNIAPNFHFMEQLFCFQQEMAKSAGKSEDGGKTELSPATKEGKTKDKKTTSSQTSTETTCAPDCKCPAHFLSPLAIGTSPDSGIEFDRWTCTSGE